MTTGGSESHPKIIWIVLGSGAAGGVVSWIYSVTLGVPPVLTSTAASILASTVLGSVAAYVSVFVLANCDLRLAQRVAGFALLSGFAWKPVLDGGLAFMDAQVTRETTREIEQGVDTVATLRAKLDAAPPSECPAIATELAKETSGLLAMLPKLRGYELRQQVEEEAIRTVAQIQAKASTYPLKYTLALGEIGHAAMKSGADEVSVHVSAGLRDISLAAKDAKVVDAALGQLNRYYPANPKRGLTAAGVANAEAAAQIALSAQPGNVGKKQTEQIQKRLSEAAAAWVNRMGKAQALHLTTLDKELQQKIKRLPR